MRDWFIAHYDVLRDFAAPVLTLVGFSIALAIAAAAFDAMKKLRRQRVEERRMEIALDALAIAYESKYVFDRIRSPMVFDYEWRSTQKIAGESEAAWQQRGQFFAVKQRILNNQDYFERAYLLQPRLMALLGSRAQEIFTLLHAARRDVELAADMLAWRVQNAIGPTPEHDEEFWRQCKRDVYDYGDFEPEKDKVARKLREFRQRMELLCRPIIEKAL
jgi:hypothetical protein